MSNAYLEPHEIAEDRMTKTWRITDIDGSNPRDVTLAEFKAEVAKASAAAMAKFRSDADTVSNPSRRIPMFKIQVKRGGRWENHYIAADYARAVILTSRGALDYRGHIWRAIDPAGHEIYRVPAQPIA